MLNLKTHKLLLGLCASALLTSTTAFAAEDPGYVLDSSGNPVMSGSSDCVVAPNQPKDQLFEVCGDIAADSDGDGVPDDKDKCPNTPKGVKVDEYGCPLDSDGDGVPDYLDECPGTPAGAKVDSRGCVPVQDDTVKTEVRATLDDKMVNFAFDKAALTASGKQVLDNVVAFINQEMAYVKMINVVGHTDSVGTEAYNQKLSVRRAKAVSDYLISKGIPAAKISTTGKGESEPVADNKTAAGRAKNRRSTVTIQLTR